MTLYDDAIVDYEVEDENKQTKTVYASFGVAVYWAQVLEKQYAGMLIVSRLVKKKPKSLEEQVEIVEKVENSRNTMGQFLGEVKQVYDLPDELNEELGQVLKKRNYLVHHYFKENIQKCYSDAGRREMMKYFSDFIDEVKQVDEQLVPLSKKYVQQLGITEEMLSQIMKEMQNE